MWFRDPTKELEEDIDIGKIDMLETFTNKLPQYPLTTPQRFAFSRRWSSGYPIYRRNKAPITFTYVLRRSISDLIRMQKRTDEVDMKGEYIWKNISCDTSYIIGMSPGGEIPVPTMVGCYSYLSEEELSQRFCEIESKMYIEDIIHIEDPNLKKYGETAEIDIDSLFPIVGIFYHAENIRATELNNHNNYTTNYEDVRLGWDPLGNVNLLYGTHPLIRDIPHIQIRRIMGRRHYPATPNVHGYGAYSLCVNPTIAPARVSLTTQQHKGKLSVRLGNTDPWLKAVAGQISASKTEKTYVPTDDKYRLHVTLLVIKELTFTLDVDKRSYSLRVGPSNKDAQ
jgi:hypothetical protein